jgi:chromosome segregation ATPase
MAAFKGVTLKVDEITKGQNYDDDDDDYENEQFDDSKGGASFAKPTTQASQAKSFATDGDSGLLNQKYKALQDEHTEQTKTVNFQKAKIAALQTELQETLEKMAENEIELELVEKENNKALTADKKSIDKINSLNLTVSKQKNTIEEQKSKILGLEKELRD